MREHKAAMALIINWSPRQDLQRSFSSLLSCRSFCYARVAVPVSTRAGFRYCLWDWFPLLPKLVPVTPRTPSTGPIAGGGLVAMERALATMDFGYSRRRLGNHGWVQPTEVCLPTWVRLRPRSTAVINGSHNTSLCEGSSAVANRASCTGPIDSSLQPLQCLRSLIHCLQHGRSLPRLPLSTPATIYIPPFWLLVASIEMLIEKNHELEQLHCTLICGFLILSLKCS